MEKIIRVADSYEDIWKVFSKFAYRKCGCKPENGDFSVSLTTCFFRGKIAIVISFVSLGPPF